MEDIRDRAADWLESGPLEVLGRLPRASNTTLLASLGTDDGDVPVVYKPARGERPLWDFPPATLCRREVATYLVSDALGWDLVPPTVLREGPLGTGSVQLYVESRGSIDPIDVIESGDPVLQSMALLDVIVNNADRKAGHCLFDTDGRPWAIDHGLTFHDEPKLRTVLWHWMGERIPAHLMRDVVALAGLIDCGEPPLPDLARLLSGLELRALRRRIAHILDAGRFPEPDPCGPALPWPPY